MDVLEAIRIEETRNSLLERALFNAKREICNKNPEYAELFTLLGEEIANVNEPTLKTLKDYNVIMCSLEYITILAQTKRTKK